MTRSVQGGQTPDQIAPAVAEKHQQGDQQGKGVEYPADVGIGPGHLHIVIDHHRPLNAIRPATSSVSGQPASPVSASQAEVSVSPISSNQIRSA